MENTPIIAGLATFCMVFLRGFQQKNVHGNHYYLAGLTSAAMCVADATVVIYLVKGGWEVLPYTITGGVIGILFSMWIHDRLAVWLERRRVNRQGHSVHLGVLVQTASQCMECGKSRSRYSCDCDERLGNPKRY